MAASERGVPLRSASAELQRASADSRASGSERFGRPSDAAASGLSPAGSARSSFALERASLEANRASLEAFHEAFATGPLMPPAKPPAQPSSPGAAAAHAAAQPSVRFDQICAAAQLPNSLREKWVTGCGGGGLWVLRALRATPLVWYAPPPSLARLLPTAQRFSVLSCPNLLPPPHPAHLRRFARLSVLPPNTPAPAATLAKLWQADALDVKASLAALAAKGILNVAQLPDGRVWCLPHAQQLELVTAACRDAAPAYHRLLLDAYASAMLPSILEEGPTEALAAAAQMAVQQMAAQQAQAQQQAQQQGHGQQDVQQQQQAAAYQQQAAAQWLEQQQQQQQQQQALLAAQRLLMQMPQHLQSIPDDGYILVNIGHHLVAGGRQQQVRNSLRTRILLKHAVLACLLHPHSLMHASPARMPARRCTTSQLVASCPSPAAAAARAAA